MVTDRRITVSNGARTVILTNRPFTVQDFGGFDSINVTNVTSQGFEQDGASLLNSFIQTRDMEIHGQIKAETTSEMQTHRETLLNLFLPKKDIEITHYYGGVERMITARVSSTPRITFSEVSTIQNYTVSLTAMEPYWHDVTDTVVTMADTRGGFHFPLIIPKDKGVTFGVKSISLIADVYNSSAIKVPLRIVFTAKGSVSNPEMLNVNTRECIRLICDMQAGEEITITSGTSKTITRYLNGLSEDYLGKIDLNGNKATFLEAEPGDNIFRYSADTGQNVLEARVYFRNKFPGV